MAQTTPTPDPVPPGKGGDAEQGTIRAPTSWVETRRETTSPSSEVTMVSSSTMEEFPEEVRAHAQDPNRQVNQYILIKVLGKGGMGEVWKAWDRKLSRWAAIKFLLGESQDGVARFKREAKMAARLSHPNIAPVHEVGEAPSRQPGQPLTHYLAMEYIDGSTLGHAKLSMRDRVDVFVKVALGIDAAHKGGVVHRDIKPANIMLTKEHWPYVMDFGLAKSLDGDNNLSATGAVMGTPAFMPPEQVEGKLEEIGPRSDVYSLGATMYAVFSGSHPFVAQTTLQLLQKVVNEAPPPPRQKNPEITPELEAVILKAMAKKQEDRYVSAGAAAEALRRILVKMDAAAENASPAPAPTPPPSPRRSSAKSSATLPLVIASVLCLLLIGGSYGVYRLLTPTTEELNKAIAEALKPQRTEDVKIPVVKKDPAPVAKIEPPATKVEPKPEVKPEIKVEPKPEVKPEVKPVVKVEAPVAKPEPKPETKPETKPEAKPEPNPEPKPEVKSEVRPLVKVEPAPEVKPAPPTPEQVLQRGVDFLSAHYRQAEFASDADYWAAYALLKSGPPDLKKKIVEFLKGTAWKQSSRATTVMALRALAIAASGDATLRPLLAECAQYLVEAQGGNGLWADGAEVSARLEDQKPAEGSAFVISGDPAPTRFQIIRKGLATKVPEGDWTVTPLVLLALAAAENGGHRLPVETWSVAAAQPWPPAAPAAGVLSWVLCRQALGEPDVEPSERVRTALKEMAIPEKGATPAQILAIERVGSLLSTPRLGDLEWYGAGSRALAASQKPDGSWGEGAEAVTGTSQALLFLTRSAAALKPVLRGGAGRLEMKSLGGCTNLMFVLDASGHMRQELENRERFDVAKETIAKIVEKLPGGALAGLRVFGHQRRADEAGNETDSALVTPIGPVNRRQLISHMEALRVKGRSPLTYTLIQTAGDLSYLPPDADVAVILFIDGQEADRKSNPVPATGDLAGSRRGLKIHVVGFNTDDDDIQTRLQKMAESGGGQYIPARSSKDLLARLTAATIGEQEFAVLNDKGESVTKGRLGDSIALPEGRYTVVCGKQQEKIWINPGLTTRIIVHQEKLAATK